jgi:hypothetical protein
LVLEVVVETAPVAYEFDIDAPGSASPISPPALSKPVTVAEDELSERSFPQPTMPPTKPEVSATPSLLDVTEPWVTTLEMADVAASPTSMPT